MLNSEKVMIMTVQMVKHVVLCPHSSETANVSPMKHWIFTISKILLSLVRSVNCEKWWWMYWQDWIVSSNAQEFANVVFFSLVRLFFCNDSKLYALLFQMICWRLESLVPLVQIQILIRIQAFSLFVLVSNKLRCIREDDSIKQSPWKHIQYTMMQVGNSRFGFLKEQKIGERNWMAGKQWWILKAVLAVGSKIVARYSISNNISC